MLFIIKAVYWTESLYVTSKLHNQKPSGDGFLTSLTTEVSLYCASCQESHMGHERKWAKRLESVKWVGACKWQHLFRQHVIDTCA